MNPVFKSLKTIRQRRQDRINKELKAQRQQLERVKASYTQAQAKSKEIEQHLLASEQELEHALKQQRMPVHEITHFRQQWADTHQSWTQAEKEAHELMLAWQKEVTALKTIQQKLQKVILGIEVLDDLILQSREAHFQEAERQLEDQSEEAFASKYTKQEVSHA